MLDRNPLDHIEFKFPHQPIVSNFYGRASTMVLKLED
jgi:hypothetical protein